MSIPISRREQVYGWVYLVIELLLLPSILTTGNRLLPHPFTEAELNFLFFAINFLAISCIFHRFLGRSGRKVRQHPVYFLQAVVLGLAAYFACRWVFNQCVGFLRPGFVNLNDQGIGAMTRSSRFLMVMGTVVLVPPAEECLYRGLIFKSLYERKPWLGYLVSTLAFAAIHLMGFVGQLSWIDLLISVIQYLPAGLCLAWSYTKADTIFAPIVIHALVNLQSIYALR